MGLFSRRSSTTKKMRRRRIHGHEVVVERADVALVLAEGVREVGVASPVARGALGVRVLPLAPFVCRRVEGVGRDGRPVLYGRRDGEP